MSWVYILEVYHWLVKCMQVVDEHLRPISVSLRVGLRSQRVVCDSLSVAPGFSPVLPGCPWMVCGILWLVSGSLRVGLRSQLVVSSRISASGSWMSWDGLRNSMTGFWKSSNDLLHYSVVPGSMPLVCGCLRFVSGKLRVAYWILSMVPEFLRLISRNMWLVHGSLGVYPDNMCVNPRNLQFFLEIRD